MCHDPPDALGDYQSFGKIENVQQSVHDLTSEVLPNVCTVYVRELNAKLRKQFLYTIPLF